MQKKLAPESVCDEYPLYINMHDAQGEWKNLSRVFEGDVSIIVIRPRPDALKRRALMIYDQKKHALVCVDEIPSENQYVCMPGDLEYVPLDKDDDMRSVVKTVFFDASMEVKLKMSSDCVLEIVYRPLINKNQDSAESSPFETFARLKKKF